MKTAGTKWIKVKNLTIKLGKILRGLRRTRFGSTFYLYIAFINNWMLLWLKKSKIITWFTNKRSWIYPRKIPKAFHSLLHLRSSPHKLWSPLNCLEDSKCVRLPSGVVRWIRRAFNRTVASNCVLFSIFQKWTNQSSNSSVHLYSQIVNNACLNLKVTSKNSFVRISVSKFKKYYLEVCVKFKFYWEFPPTLRASPNLFFMTFFLYFINIDRGTLILGEIWHQLQSIQIK